MKTILDRLQKNGPQWIRAFLELAKLYKEAGPEQRAVVLDFFGRTQGMN